MSVAKKVVNAAKSGKMPKKALMKNNIILLLDRSGSMDSIRDKAREVFNQQIINIRDASALDSNQITKVCVHQFDGRLYKGYFQSPDMIPLLNQNTYNPDGVSTALLDAIGESINLANDDGESSYVLIVVTDGDENRSSKFDSTTLTNLIREVNKTDRWSIVCLVPPGSAGRTASWGIPAGNITEWESTYKGIEEAGKKMAAGVSQYYTSRQAGATSVSTFFTTNMTGVTKKDLKQCKNVSGEFYVWEVDKTSRIDKFVESQGHTYRPTMGFYQLTKLEKSVQSYKDMILLHKATGMMYGGEEVREILGMPAYDVKVRPGDHGDFDIFIMSKSYNRKLVAGTRMLYRR